MNSFGARRRISGNEHRRLYNFKNRGKTSTRARDRRETGTNKDRANRIGNGMKYSTDTSGDQAERRRRQPQIDGSYKMPRRKEVEIRLNNSAKKKSHPTRAKNGGSRVLSIGSGNGGNNLSSGKAQRRRTSRSRSIKKDRDEGSDKTYPNPRKIWNLAAVRKAGGVEYS